jgi:uncharacterized protein YgiM (DUF1202 family)
MADKHLNQTKIKKLEIEKSIPNYRDLERRINSNSSIKFPQSTGRGGLAQTMKLLSIVSSNKTSVNIISI